MFEITIIILLVLNVGLIGYLLLRRQSVQVEQDTQGLVLLQNQLQELTRAMDNKLSEGSDRMFESMKTQFDQSQKLMSDITTRVSDQLLEVTKGVTETKESTKQVFTIAEQLSNLEKVLKNQKQRGNLGEASLELVLSNVLPPGQFTSQYQFADGDAVDMVVRTSEGLIPVDAKFPLENYLRLIDEVDEVRKEQFRKEFRSDVKKRIDETSKYIREQEGTMPFAFMFIPSEAIYYDLLNNDVGIGINSRGLIEYAYKEKHVIITSPTTFLAYLQTVLFGNQRMKIQEDSKKIIKNIGELSKHLNAYQEHHNKLGKSLSQTVGHFEASGKAYKLIDKDIVKITDEGMELRLESVDRPLLETVE
jgi:DNA recombination protein RmuC